MLRTSTMLLCAAGAVAFPNPHPHVLLDSQDAIATACDDWTAKYPDQQGICEDWKELYSAKLVDGVWVLTPSVPGGHPGQGTFIKVDAKNGNIVSVVSID